MGTRAAVGRALALAGIAMGWAGNNAALGQAAPWQVVAREDGPAPGIPGEPGAEFFILDGPAVNNSGQVAFEAALDAGSLQRLDTGSVWTGTAGNLQLVVREGDVAPGTTTTFSSFWDDPLINNAGQVLVQGRLDGPVAQSDGLWLGVPGNMQLLARTNVPLPGLAKMIDDINPSSLALGDGGHVAFLGWDDDTTFGLYSGKPGALTVVAQEGMTVPAGTPLSVGGTFAGSFLPPSDSPTINASGHLAFSTAVDVGSYYGDTIWVGAPGALQLLAYEDMPVPGMPGVEFFLLTSPPILNNSGQATFQSTLSNFQESIWRGTPGNLQRIAYGTQTAPVGVAGVRFDDIGAFSNLRLNDSGQVAFEASLEGTGVTFDNNSGLFVAGSGGVTMVARTGNAAPGMGAGAVFDGFQQFSLNGAGRVAFIANATGGSAGSYTIGLWAQTSSGVLELVVREGDWVNPLTGVVVRMADALSEAAMESLGYGEVFSIDFRSGDMLENEFGTAWNDSGRIAFSVNLSHASVLEAVFIANLNARPGDFDGDGDVDGGDFLVWQRGAHTASDLAAWKANFGTSATPTTAAVPEPAGAALAMMAMGAMVVGSRRGRLALAP
jgi:hypothetical protein